MTPEFRLHDLCMLDTNHPCQTEKLVHLGPGLRCPGRCLSHGWRMAWGRSYAVWCFGKMETNNSQEMHSATGFCFARKLVGSFFAGDHCRYIYIFIHIYIYIYIYTYIYTCEPMSPCTSLYRVQPYTQPAIFFHNCWVKIGALFRTTFGILQSWKYTIGGPNVVFPNIGNPPSLEKSTSVIGEIWCEDCPMLAKKSYISWVNPQIPWSSIFFIG